jgi:hypothetical protein
MVVADAANSNGKRVGYVGPYATVKFTGVKAAVSGTNELVVYYANGDCGSSQRFFNVKVNGGAPQSRSFGTLGCGDWHEVGQTKISLSGFVAGSGNTVEFLGDGKNASPDLDWIEVINTGASSGGGGTSPATY